MTLPLSKQRKIHIEETFDVDGSTRWVGYVEPFKEKKLLVLKVNDQFLAVDLLCKHAGAPLRDARIEDDAKLICLRHEHEYDLVGKQSIAQAVVQKENEFFLVEKSEDLESENSALKDKVAKLEIALDAQRAANSALQQQVITSMEDMDAMVTEIELRKTEWKDKSTRLEKLNDLVNRVTNSIAEVMFISGPNGKIQRVNNPALQLFGCKDTDFVGRSLDELLSPDDLLNLSNRYADQLNLNLPVIYQLCFIEAPLELEARLRLPDEVSNGASPLTTFLFRGTRLYDKNGKEEGAILVANDISAFKEREMRERQKEIEKTLKLFEVTLNNVGQGIAVFDYEGYLMVANEAFSHVTHSLPEWEIAGTPYQLFLDHEDRETGLCTISAKDRSHSVLLRQSQSWESYYHDLRVVEYSSNPMPNGGFVLVARDVTTSKKEAETIRRLSYAMEQSPVEVIITDTEGTIEYVNAKFVENTGYSKENAIGRKTNMVRSGQMPNQYYESLWETLKSGRHWRGEVLNKRKDGSLFWQMLSVAPMYDPDGVIRNYLATKENIDERKRAEEELARHRDHLQDLVEERSRELIIARDEAEQANNAKTEFLSSMSHELRTPLNGILGFAQLLEMNQKEPLSAMQGEYVKHILKAGQHLLGLISEILDLAKIESGKMSLDMREFLLYPILIDSIALVHQLADDHNITINNFITDKELTVYGDETRVKQTIVNILSNAVKYNRDGGEVYLNANVTTMGHLELSIKDTGKGIEEAKMHDLFTPFNRLGVEGQNIEGSGIGLTITRKLLHMMGGDIQVDSEVDVGSTFTLRYQIHDRRRKRKPVSQDSAMIVSLEEKGATQDEVSQEREKILAFQGKKILYIEDNWSNQFLVERAMINFPGLSLKCVSDARSGIEIAFKEVPDLILLDINLPGMDGYEAFAELQKRAETEVIPVVALSAKALDADIEKGLKTGFRSYLTKPLNIPDLLTTIETVLFEKVI